MKNLGVSLIKSKYHQLSELGSKFNLSFTSHLALGNKLIGLDGIRKCLLVCETDNGLNQSYIIELNEVGGVSIKKSYGSIASGELKNKTFEEFLKSIDLQFEYNNNKEARILRFYDCEKDDPRNLPVLERNAKNWQMIFCKMISLEMDKVVEKRKALVLD